MARDQAQHQRRLAVSVKIGPVHRNQDVPLRTDLLRDPAGEAVPHVNARVAHQPVYLLDRVLGHQTPCLRQRLPDHCHGKRGPRHHPKRGARQCIDPFGVQVRPIKPADEASDLPQTLRLDHAPNLSLDHTEVLRSAAESRLYRTQRK